MSPLFINNRNKSFSHTVFEGVRNKSKDIRESDVVYSFKARCELRKL